MAHYAIILLAPLEGFGLCQKLFWAIWQKKTGNGQKYDSIGHKSGNTSFVFLSIVVTFFSLASCFCQGGLSFCHRKASSNYHRGTKKTSSSD